MVEQTQRRSSFRGRNRNGTVVQPPMDVAGAQQQQVDTLSDPSYDGERPVYQMGTNLPYLPNFMPKILMDEVRVHTNRSVVTVSEGSSSTEGSPGASKFNINLWDAIKDKFNLARATLVYSSNLSWANRGFCIPALMVYFIIVARCASAIDHEGESETWDALLDTCSEWGSRGNDYAPSMLATILPIFLVVFYVNAAIKRYYKMYDACREMADITDQAVGICMIDFRKHPECLKEQVRCMHIARMLVLLHTARDTYPVDEFFVPLCSCFGDKAGGLLTAAEVKKIRAEGYSEHLCQAYTIKALNVVFAATKKGIISEPGAAMRMNHLNQMMEASQVIGRLTSMQYPPTYTYLVSSTVGISCMLEIAFASTRVGLLWGQMMFWESLVITLILLVAQQVCLFGILGVAGEMVDPFGTDIRDFPILHMCIEPLQHTMQLLWRYFPMRDDEQANEGFISELGEEERKRQRILKKEDLQFRHKGSDVGEFHESCLVSRELLLTASPAKLGEHYSKEAERTLLGLKSQIKEHMEEEEADRRKRGSSR